MKKLGKLVAGLALAFALFTSSIPNAQAQQSLTYVSRQAYHLTTAATTVVQSSDSYIVSVVVNVSVAGAGSTITIQNKEGTPKKLAVFSSAAVGNFNIALGPTAAAAYMKGGIDIVVSSTAPTCDVFITSYKP